MRGRDSLRKIVRFRSTLPEAGGAGSSGLPAFFSGILDKDKCDDRNDHQADEGGSGF